MVAVFSPSALSVGSFLFSCPPMQGTAAGRGSATSLEFLEGAYKAVNAVAPAGERGRRESERGPSTPAKGNTSNSNKEEDEEDSETEESADEDEEVQKPETARRDTETAVNASDDDDDGVGDSPGAKGRGARGRRGSGSGSGSDTGSATEPLGGSSGSTRLVGFGVVGEGETVELALQALAKVC